MRVCNIFDIGSFVHAGACNTHAFIESEPRADSDGYRMPRIPCGGIAQVLKAVKTCGENDTFVFACDRNPSIKKGMYPAYKAQREHKKHVELEKEITEYILKDCGFLVLDVEGYEADDIIYSLVQRHKKSYDMINVYTADSDIYLVVDDNVRIMPPHSRAKMVTRENYRETVSSTEYVEYNTLTYMKILRGDKSDNIPPLSYNCMSKLPPAMGTAEEFAKLGNKEYILSRGACAGQEFIDQVNLVFPLTVDVPDTLIEHGDLKRVRLWGRTMHCSAFGTGLSVAPAEIKPSIEDMISRGLYED